MKKEAPDWLGCGRIITTESWNGFLKARAEYYRKQDMKEHQSLAIQALEQMKGDDLARARLAFAVMSPLEMNMRYGMSSQTPKEILAGYETLNARIAAAIAWVKGQAE
jgi:hypothetical protein